MSISESTEHRQHAATLLGNEFDHLDDKEAAWQDLHRLTQDHHFLVRKYAVAAIELAFPNLPSDHLVWQDLHRLANDRNRYVRWEVGCVLGSLFPSLPYKSLVWRELDRLSKEKDEAIRSISYHSLGRACIFKATEADDRDLKAHLEEAIEFFQKSSDSPGNWRNENHAVFCLPFYKSLHSLLFRDVSKAEEIQRYLAEAKRLRRQ